MQLPTEAQGSPLLQLERINKVLLYDTESDVLSPGVNHMKKNFFFLNVCMCVYGVGDGQGGLACCSPWGCKESDMTE